MLLVYFYAKGLYISFGLTKSMNKSKKLKEFEHLWIKIEKIRKDPKMMKVLDKLIKLTTS